MTDVSVAIANWNGMRYLPSCLEAIYSQTYAPAEVVIVDNGSVDGSFDWISSNYPNVCLIRNESNEGFAAGYNQAINCCRGECILILNTDVFLEGDFIEHAVNVMGLGGKIGAVAGRVYQQATGEWINSGFNLHPQMRSRHVIEQDLSCEVFGCSGALILFRAEMLNDVSIDGEIFDKSYFSYGEDIDLAWRSYIFGWRCRYEPNARARHIGSGASDGQIRFWDKPLFLQRHILSNRFLTLVKNAAWSELFILIPYWLIIEPLVWLTFLMRNPYKFISLIPVWASIFRKLPRALKWRRIIQSRRMVKPLSSLKHFVWY